MPSDREAADLAAIKAREAAVRAAINRGDPEVDIGGAFSYGQLRLSSVVADEWGHLWRVDRNRLVLLNEPAGAREGRIAADEASYNAGADAAARNGDG